MRRCAICGGGNDVLRGWCDSPHPVCTECQEAIAEHYFRQPRSHETPEGMEGWVQEEIERRRVRPTPDSKQACSDERSA